MAIRVIPNAVKLEIYVTQTRFCRLTAKFLTFRELDSICRRLDGVIPNFSRVPNRLKEVRRNRRLTAGKLDRHLPPWLDRNRVIEDLLNVVHTQLMDEPHLVCVHETRIAHH